MAYGSELFLGFTHPEMNEIAKAVGLTINWDRKDVAGGVEVETDEALDAINQKLVTAYLECMENDMGFTVSMRTEFGHYRMTTPFGPRQMSPWYLGLYYDPDEMGDDETQAVFGISLVHRYFPCFLDWREQFGGSGTMVRFDNETMTNIEIARRAIMTVLPQWNTANICFKDIHY